MVTVLLAVITPKDIQIRSQVQKIAKYEDVKTICFNVKWM